MSYRILIPALCVLLSACGKDSSSEAKKKVETVSTDSAPAKKSDPPPPAFDPEKTGTVAGTVKFEGEIPKPRVIRMNADPKCAALHAEKVFDDSLVVDADRNVKWAFVYVKEGLPEMKFAVPAEPVLLDQVGCMYEPKVFGMMAGQDILIRNSDDLLHNIHALPLVNREFNIGQAQKGMTEKKKFTEKEIMIHIKCDIHPWMSAKANVVDHPFFAVTDGKGRFEIKGLPAGKYTLEVRQERCVTATAEVTVEAGKAATADFAVKEKK